MKLKKVIISLISAALAVAVLSVGAFAERDFTSEASGLEFDGIAGWGGGQWLMGTDNEAMADPLTIADLEAADHFEFTYKTEGVPPTTDPDDPAVICFIYKFAVQVGDDGTLAVSEAYLPDGWFDYGPSGEAGNTYRAETYFSFPVQDEGTIIVKTEDIINSLNVDKDTILYLWQFGLGTNLYSYDSDWTDENDAGDHYPITVTSVKLSDEEADIAATETSATTTEPETSTTTEEVTSASTTPAETTTTVATAQNNSQQSGINDNTGKIIVIVVICVLVVAAIVVLIIMLTKKKK